MTTLKYFCLFILLIFSNESVASDMHANANDAFYMQKAIDLAKHNPKAPFAAVIVDNQTGKMIADGINASDINPVLHGEIVAINHAAKKYPHLDWSRVTLYTTAEPCPMCQSAIIWAGISRVVFGTSIAYLKQHGWHQIEISSKDVSQHAVFHQVTITDGVLADKTNALF